MHAEESNRTAAKSYGGPLSPLFSPFGFLLGGSLHPFWVFLIVLAISVPLIYGFIGLRDPFNLLNFIIIAPSYFGLGSKVIRDLDANLDSMFTSTTMVEAKFKRPTPIASWFSIDARILIGSAVALAFQLLYVYNELGWGPDPPKFQAYQGMHAQNWIASCFEPVFFLWYIGAQFFTLWFAIVVAMSLIDISVGFLKIAMARNTLLRIDQTMVKDWSHEAKNSFKWCSVLSAMMILNAFTYKVNVKPATTVNLSGFEYFALFLFILAFAGVFFVSWLHERSFDKVATRRGRVRRIFVDARLAVTALFSTVSPVIMLYTRIQSVRTEQTIRSIYSFIGPIFESLFGFR